MNLAEPHWKLGALMKGRRAYLGLTIRGAARLAGISHANYHHLESGKTRNPEVSTLVGISKALQCPATMLFRACLSLGSAREAPEDVAVPANGTTP